MDKKQALYGSMYRFNLLRGYMRPYNCKVGLEFHEFRVIKDLGRKYPKQSSKCKSVFVVVECIHCHEELEGQLTHFKYGARQCLKCFPKKWKVKKNYIGQKHGEFLIIKDDMIKFTGKDRRVTGSCLKCEKEFEHNYFSFKNLKIICECKYELERTKDWKRIRAIYFGMIYRCHDKNFHNYLRYGGRGIIVCDEWRNNKRAFYDWSMQNGYQNHLSIDRIDNDLGYNPENCRWATMLEQCRNKRKVMSLENAKEIKKLLSLGITHNEIARITNISHHAVSSISKGATWNDAG